MRDRDFNLVVDLHGITVIGEKCCCQEGNYLVNGKVHYIFAKTRQIFIKIIP